MQEEETNSAETESLLSHITECIPDALSIATRGTSAQQNKSMDKGSLDMAFSWRKEFRRQCVLALIEPSVNKLDELMAYYIDKIAADSNACYSKPKRAVKLKKILNDAMLFFFFHHKDLQGPMENSAYLEKMSQLLTYYMDLSIKTSSSAASQNKRKKTTARNVANRLLMTLYMYLEGSPEYILDTVLRSKFLTKNYRSFCIPILSKIADDLSTEPCNKEATTSSRKEPRNKITMYVRYVLMFKVWKKIVRGVEQRKRINQLASSRLTPPDHFREAIKQGALSDVLPKVPSSKAKNITDYYMVSKFDVKEKIQDFFKLRNTITKQFEIVTELDKAHFFSENSPDLDFGHSSNNLDEVGTSRLNRMIDEFLADFKEQKEQQPESVKENEKEKNGTNNKLLCEKQHRKKNLKELLSFPLHMDWLNDQLKYIFTSMEYKLSSPEAL